LNVKISQLWWFYKRWYTWIIGGPPRNRTELRGFAIVCNAKLPLDN